MTALRCSTSLMTSSRSIFICRASANRASITLGENLDPLAAGQRRPLVGDVGPGRAPFLDDAGGLELAIRAGDRARD